MATSPVTPAPSSSIGELLHTAIATPEPTTPATPAPLTSPEAPPAEPPPVEPVTPPVETPAVPAEQPVAEPPAETPDEPLDFTGDLAPDSVDATNKRHFFSVGKSMQLQAAGKILKEVSEVMPNVSAAGIKDAVERSTAAQQMMTSFEAAAQNPAAVKEVVDVFMPEPNSGPEAAQAFSALVLESLSRLPQVNPQAFNHVLAVHNNHTITALRDRARGTVDPTARDQAVALALRFEEAITGKFTPSSQWIGGQQADPLQDRLRSVEERERALQERAQREQQTQQQQFQGHLGQVQESAIGESIAAALGAEAAKSPFFANMQQELRAKIEEVEKAHPEWGAQWNTLMQQAQMYRNDTAIKAVSDFRRTIAQRVARANAASIVSKYATVQLANNQSAHVRAAQTSEPSLNGAGAPAPNGAVEAALKDPDLKSALRKALYV